MPIDAPTLTIARVSRLLENHATELSLPQYRVLGLLAGGSERATELAARLAVTKPTLTALIDGLVERGYVARESSDDDRRAVRLSVTPAGHRAATDAGRELRGALADVLDRCADPDAVLAALDDLRAALDARWVERLAAGQGNASATGKSR